MMRLSQLADDRRLRRALPYLICLYFAILAVAYAQTLPIFEATDEGAHFLYIHNLLESGELPVLTGRLAEKGDAALTERWSFERHQPPLYYLAGALLVSWTDRHDIDEYLRTNTLIFMRSITEQNFNMWLHNPDDPGGDTAAAVWTLRLFSVALGVGTLLFIYHAGRLAFGEWAGLVALALVASIPMHISLSGSINNDNLVRFCFAAGVYWSLRTWRQRAITPLDMAALGLILAGAALSKVTGVTLFGIVYLALVMGAVRKHYTWRRMGMTIAVTLALAALLAGWWYLRNLSLYGDFLANQATIAFFSETPEQRQLATTLAPESVRVWRTFWFGIGYLHSILYGPAWLYHYAGVLVIAGSAGLALAWRRRPDWRDTILFFLAICAAAFAALIVGTRSIDISYGRTLYPALVAFAPLMAVGWRSLLGRWLGGALWLPVALVALVVPVKYQPDAYPMLEPVDVVSVQAVPLDAQAESLALLGYELRDALVTPGGMLRLWLYVRGVHPENPTLAITAVDSVSQAILGGVDLYPGMAPTNRLNPDTIYRVQADLPLDPTPGLSPRKLSLVVGWTIPAPPRTLPWHNAAGEPIGALVLDGPLWLDPAYHPPAPDSAVDVVYGGVIRLQGYSLSAAAVAPGETLDVTLHWDYAGPADTDWTAAVGLLDEASSVLTNADGMPPGYPTTLWQPGMAFADTRTLVIPPDAPPGTYRLYIGWYRLSDGERLIPRGAGVEGSLYIAPESITVTPPDTG